MAVRGGPAAKSRLAARLDSRTREHLVEAMLSDMLAALTPRRAIRGICVTTPTPALADIARLAGARVLEEPSDINLNAAFAAARCDIATRAPETPVLLLPGDLPLLDGAEIDRLAAEADAGGVLIAPAEADGGTAALVLPAGLPFDLAFGPDSFGRHLESARRSGVPVRTLRLPGLGLDIDSSSDLEAFWRRGGRGLTAEVLRPWRIEEGAAA